jgi:hypothetical protein
VCVSHLDDIGKGHIGQVRLDSFDKQTKVRRRYFDVAQRQVTVATVDAGPIAVERAVNDRHVGKVALQRKVLIRRVRLATKRAAFQRHVATHCSRNFKRKCLGTNHANKNLIEKIRQTPYR